MTEFLIRHFVKEASEVRRPRVRQAYGNLSSIVGIIVNLMLALTKALAGLFSGSVSIGADAVNNLSDAGSSLVSLLSFRIAAKPADPEHPFGHARIEYVFSTLVAMIIMFIGGQFLIESVRKILKPDDVRSSALVITILVLSILSKVWLYFFYRNIGKRIGSELLHATAADSLSDVLSTSVVLVSLLLTPLIGFQLDGYMGLVVALLILKSGYDILRKGIDLILGYGISDKDNRELEEWIRKYEGVLGVHDLIIHDYGPGHRFVSVHIEVDSRTEMMEAHQLIDAIENDAMEELKIQLIAHMDPLDVQNPELQKMREIADMSVRRVHPELSLHDFRLIRGHNKMNLVFDCQVPAGLRADDAELREKIQAELDKLQSGYRAVITFDRSYVRGRRGGV